MLRRDLLRKGLLPNPPPNLFVKDPRPTPLLWGWTGIFCEKVLKGVWGRTFPQKVSPGISLQINFIRCGSGIINYYSERSTLSLASSSPAEILNFSRRSALVSFCFSSPLTSKTIRPLLIIIRRLPYLIASFIL